MLHPRAYPVATVLITLTAAVCAACATQESGGGQAHLAPPPTHVEAVAAAVPSAAVEAHSAVVAEARSGGGQPRPPDLTGSHTRRSEAACTLYVAPGGDDARDGGSYGRALRTPARAVAVARPGDVVCFDAGIWPPLVVKDVEATADAPLVFRTVPGAELQATFTTGALTRGDAVHIERSSHVHIYDLRLTGSQGGIGVWGCRYGRLEGLRIESIGQEAIHIGRGYMGGAKGHFVAPPSADCDVIGNTVRDTGRVTARYGEGVYIGTGRSEGDDSHGMFIGYNRFDGVRAEAIELKPHTFDHIVRGNLVTSGSHLFHAAITVGAQAVSAPDARALIEDNRIFGYASTRDVVSGIAVGHGNTIVRNNVVWGIGGGRGIRTTTTFANPLAREVLIENNTVWTPGGGPSIALDDGDEGTGVHDQVGHVTARNNVTDDGSAGSTQVSEADLVGPVTGSADARQGPGSGLRVKRPGGGGADLGRSVGP